MSELHAAVEYLFGSATAFYFRCSQLRRARGDRSAGAAGRRRSVRDGLLRKIDTTTYLGERNCPILHIPMRQFFWEQPPFQLDACKPCNLVWFDAGNSKLLPEEQSHRFSEMHMSAAEADGQHRIEQMRENESKDAEPDETWKIVAGISAVFPWKGHRRRSSRRPWATWILSSVIAFSASLRFSI